MLGDGMRSFHRMMDGERPWSDDSPPRFDDCTTIPLPSLTLLSSLIRKRKPHGGRLLQVLRGPWDTTVKITSHLLISASPLLFLRRAAAW